MENPEIKAVIFDCDGVLVDSEIIASRISLQNLKPFGLEMETSDYAKKYAGKREEDILALIQQEYNITLPEGFLPDLRIKIEYALDHELEPIAGAKDTISKITKKKAVVSNSRLVRVIHSLKVAGLSELFGETLFAAEMVKRPKPFPDVYLYAAQKLELAPSSCLVVEDSISGVTAAHTAGMHVIGFLGGSHIFEGHKNNLIHAGAFSTVKDMPSLHKLLLSYKA